jgi:hypothetical protein
MLIALATTILIGLLSNWCAGGLAGLLTAMGTGVGKEYGDKINPYNKWDWCDILADLIGTIVGITIGIIIIIL